MIIWERLARNGEMHDWGTRPTPDLSVSRNVFRELRSRTFVRNHGVCSREDENARAGSGLALHLLVRPLGW